MADEWTELLDTAIYKEIASQAFYIAGQGKTEDPGAKALLEELAEQELKHAGLLKDLKAKGLVKQDWHQERVPNLMISEYLTGPDTVEGIGLQEVLILAMKREQQSPICPVKCYTALAFITYSAAIQRWVLPGNKPTRRVTEILTVVKQSQVVGSLFSS